MNKVELFCLLMISGLVMLITGLVMIYEPLEIFLANNFLAVVAIFLAATGASTMVVAFSCLFLETKDKKGVRKGIKRGGK